MPAPARRGGSPRGAGWEEAEDGAERAGAAGSERGAGEPGSGDPRAGFERGGEWRPGKRGGKARRAPRRRPLLGALSGPPARTAPQPSGRKRCRQRPGRALGLPHLPASGGSPGGTRAGRARRRREDRPPAPQPSRPGAPRSPRGAPAPWRPGSGSRSTDFRKTR